MDTRLTAISLSLVLLMYILSAIQYGHQGDSNSWMSGIGGQGTLRTSKRRRSNDIAEVYLLPGLYSGLSNQRLSFFYSAAIAIKYNWTLVLPHWRLEYNDLAFGTRNSGSSAPFHYFHDLKDNRTAISRENLHHHVVHLPITIAGKEEVSRQLRFVSELPHALLHECLSQLQCNSFWQCKSPDASILERWANDLGVVCSNAETSYYAFRSMLHDDHPGINLDDVPSLPVINSIRRSFVPSDLFSQLTVKALESLKFKFNSTSFVSLHLRTEEDFKQACEVWIPRSFQGGETLNCFEDEISVKTRLLESSIPKDSILFVMNGDEKLPKSICLETDYRCIRKSMLFDGDFDYPRQFVRSSNSLAMLDYTISLNAQSFIGNVYSTMSVELYHEFVNNGKPASFYNTKHATRKNFVGQFIQSLVSYGG